MGFWQPLTNLRDYVSQNPPVVTFFLCLLTLAVTFVCLSSYSYNHNVPNPDTTKVRSHLLSSLSQFKLCVNSNASLPELVSPTTSPLRLRKRDVSVHPTNTPSVTTLHLRVPLVVTPISNSDSLKNLALHTALNSSQLRLEGNDSINMTLEIVSGNDTYTCLTISAPTHLLPMSLLPSKCPASEKNISPIHVEATKQLHTVSQTCYSLRSENDPSLMVMLTPEERSVAARHLLEVSVCLLGVCGILCLAASMTHSLVRRHYWNGLDLQNELLIDS
ncbi:transmembrane protein 248 isoform X2 [Labrus mixtus]|uniref:transmembrane protein 248 isoform X2 n=1 Tax=Labrus mixtus TaxID=508554 RepID=UPI0029BFF3A4|nr:transmembrane protein 248 isoform X2 [Labrus mixtus]